MSTQRRYRAFRAAGEPPTVLATPPPLEHDAVLDAINNEIDLRACGVPPSPCFARRTHTCTLARLVTSGSPCVPRPQRQEYTKEQLEATLELMSDSTDIIDSLSGIIVLFDLD